MPAPGQITPMSPERLAAMNRMADDMFRESPATFRESPATPMNGGDDPTFCDCYDPMPIENCLTCQERQALAGDNGVRHDEGEG